MRIFKRNQAIQNQLLKIIEQNSDLLLPSTLVEEKVYFVPNDLKLYDKIQDQSLPIYLSGTLNNKEWHVKEEPCEMDSETNLYFAYVRRHLDEKIVFKFQIGNKDLGCYYELSSIYDTDDSVFINNKLQSGFSSICEANYQMHQKLCEHFARFKNKTIEHIRAT